MEKNEVLRDVHMLVALAVFSNPTSFQFGNILCF